MAVLRRHKAFTTKLAENPAVSDWALIPFGDLMNHAYNDFDINSTHLSPPAPISKVPHHVMIHHAARCFVL